MIPVTMNMAPVQPGSILAITVVPGLGEVLSMMVTEEEQEEMD
jgi:hypothetical protein